MTSEPFLSNDANEIKIVSEKRLPESLESLNLNLTNAISPGNMNDTEAKAIEAATGCAEFSSMHIDARGPITEEERRDGHLHETQLGVVDASLTTIRDQTTSTIPASRESVIENNRIRSPSIKNRRETPSVMKDEKRNGHKPANKAPSAFSLHLQEVLKVIPEIRLRSNAVHSSDLVVQDALLFLRAITLLMRFRSVFPHKDYEQIMRCLEDEYDVQRIGGIECFMEMAVQAGYLQQTELDSRAGYAATGAGAKLIERVTLSAMHVETIGTSLQRQIIQNYTQLKPTRESDAIRLAILTDIQKRLDSWFPQSSLLVELFGSGGNGLYFPGSDSDVCVYYSKVPPERSITIYELGVSLRQANWTKNVSIIAHAKIPVVKMTHIKSGLPVDVSIENTIAIENTRLIGLYMDLDSRVKPLAFALKVWCKSRAISHPRDGTLSSYSYTLMLIHYLQRTYPPVLPNLQSAGKALRPFEHTYEREIIQCFYDENPVFVSKNKQDVAALLLGFFRYYATEFDFDNCCVNIRHDVRDPLLKSEKGTRDWGQKRIAIEDPFIEHRNTAVACYDILANWIIDELKRGYRILAHGGNFHDLVAFVQ